MAGAGRRGGTSDRPPRHAGAAARRRRRPRPAGRPDAESAPPAVALSRVHGDLRSRLARVLSPGGPGTNMGAAQVGLARLLVPAREAALASHWTAGLQARS